MLFFVKYAMSYRVPVVASKENHFHPSRSAYLSTRIAL